MITELNGYVKATHTAFTKVMALILAFAVLCAGTAFATSPSYVVDIYDGLEVTRVSTMKNDALDIVKQADIEIEENDRLELSEFSVSTDSIITIYRAAAVSFTDLNGTVMYMVFAGTVSDLLNELSVTLSEDVLVSQAVDTVLSDGMDVKLTSAYRVTVAADGAVSEIKMGEGTVADALEIAGISLDSDDEVSPAADSCVYEGTAITVYRVEYTSRTVTETIAYANKTIKSAELYTDQKSVTQKGADGSQKVTYRDKIVDGALASTEVVEQTVITEAVPQITTVGTKSKPISVSLKNNKAPISELTPPSSLVIENGAPTSYSKIITGKAAAYTASSGAKTASGRTVKPGYIAVDPKQIPYGTELWIVSTSGIVYGYAIAADTGGFVKKGKFTVDLFMNTNAECRQWGSRDVIIYVL